MAENILGYGRELLFEHVGGKSNHDISISTLFTHCLETSDTFLKAEALYQTPEGTVTLGSGTYKECYDLCVAKKKELESKVYNWRDCTSDDGFYIDVNSNIFRGRIDSYSVDDKNFYPTKEDAEAALAHCQLLHIVNKINEDYPRVCKYNHQVFVDNELNFDITNIAADEVYEGLILNSKEGAEILIRDNEELLKTYLKIKL